MEKDSKPSDNAGEGNFLTEARERFNVKNARGLEELVNVAVMDTQRTIRVEVDSDAKEFLIVIFPESKR